MRNISDYAFKPFDCGCKPYVNAFSYEGWWQYGQHVKYREVGRKPQLFELGPRGVTEGREKLFCDCQTAAAPKLHTQRAARERATRDASFIETDRIVAGPKVGFPAIERIRPAVVAPPELVIRNHSNGPAVARIPVNAVATSPAEIAVQPASIVDRELYETALKVQQNTEASLLDDMLSPQEPEVVTVAAHPLTEVLPQQERRVRTITNATVLEERATERNGPRAPQTQTQRPNTNEISAAPEGAMPLAEMMAQLTK
jgi:hypothetical protein